MIHDMTVIQAVDSGKTSCTRIDKKLSMGPSDCSVESETLNTQGIQFPSCIGCVDIRRTYPALQ